MCLELSTETGILLRVWRQVHAGCHCVHFLLEHEVPSNGVVAIGAARPGTVAEHRLSTGCSRSQEGSFWVPSVAAPSAWRLDMVQILVRLQKVGVQEIRWKCNANCSDIPWTDTSTAAPWRTSRYRTSERARPSKGSASTLCSLCLGFRPSSLASMCFIRWAWARRKTRLEICLSIWSLGRVGRKLFPISCMCDCACVFVCSSLCPVVFCLSCKPKILPHAIEKRSDC